MSMDYYVIASLCALLCFERVWSTITITRLVNKLMSKNYQDYVEGKRRLKEPVKHRIKVPQVPDDIAHDVNEAFGTLPL